MKPFFASLSLCVCLLVAGPAQALDAGDYLNRMDPDQRSGFMFGLTAMHSYHALLDGNETLARCIAEQANTQETLDRIYAAFERWPDKAAEGLVVLVLNQACEG